MMNLPNVPPAVRFAPTRWDNIGDRPSLETWALDQGECSDLEASQVLTVIGNLPEDEFNSRP
jgi:hypothetical protein